MPAVTVYLGLLLLGQMDPDLLKKIEKECTSAYDGYLEDTKKYEEKAVSEDTFRAGGTERKLEFYSYKNGKNQIFETNIFRDKSDNKSEWKSFVGNSRYSFDLKKTQAGSFVLMGYELNAKEDGMRVLNQRDNAFNELFFLIRAARNDERNRIKVLEKLPDGMVRVVMDYYTDSDKSYYGETTIYCEPEKKWRLMKIVHKRGTRTTTEEMIYDASSATFTYPMKIHSIAEDTKIPEGTRSRSTTSIEVKTLEAKSDSLFTLANYGLSEPAELMVKQSWTVYYVAGLAVVAFVIGYWFFLKK